MSLQNLGLGFSLLLGAAFSSVSRADQPIFNEMPRWDNGWGFQLIEEYRHDSDLMSGDVVVADGFSGRCAGFGLKLCGKVCFRLENVETILLRRASPSSCSGGTRL